MTTAFLLFLTLLQLNLIVAVPAQRVPDYRDPARAYDEGWESLFNGRDLSGWVVVLMDEQTRESKSFLPENQSVFFVEDGLLKTTGKPPGCLRTLDIYDNYVFRLEIRFPAGQGNTGILVHCQNDVVWPTSIECQGYQGHMGRIFPLGEATLQGGEMIHAAANPPGQWNTYEVYSDEGRLATVVNGKLVGLGSNADPWLGHICLQSEGVPVEFRKIKIKRFTPANAMRSRPSGECRWEPPEETHAS